MANPQIEDGYIKISTEFWEALCRIRIPGVPRQVFDFIIRQTYGWQKKMDNISLSQFVLATGLKKTTIIKSINQLIEMNLITIIGNDSINKYGINKDFDTWKLLPKKVTLPIMVKDITNKGNSSLPIMVHTITTTTKDNKEKYISLPIFPTLKITQEELDKLSELLGDKLNHWLESLDLYIQSTGKKYKSHYATILVWTRKEKKQSPEPKGPEVVR